MQRISPHIAYLLTKHECVIVPGFGAFVVQISQAKWTEEDGIFSPPVRLVGFNTDIKHNDALLSGSLMRERNISYDEANILVRQFREQLVQCIEHKGEAEIPLVGKFSLSVEKKMIFTPSNESASNALLYGFCNFHLPSLDKIEVLKTYVNNGKDKDVIWIPINKRLISMAASVAAVAFAFLLLSTPISNEQIPSQYASMISVIPGTETIRQTEQTTTSNDETNNKAIVIDTTRQSLPIDTASESLVNPAKPTHLYYIVIRSYPNITLARKEFAEIQSTEFKDASILEKDNKSRIFVRTFEDRNKAESFLNEFRISYPKYKDAWLLSEHIGS